MAFRTLLWIIIHVFHHIPTTISTRHLLSHVDYGYSQWIGVTSSQSLLPLLPRSNRYMAAGVWNKSIFMFGGMYNEQSMVEYDTTTQTMIDYGKTNLNRRIWVQSQSWTQQGEILYILGDWAPPEDFIHKFNLKTKQFVANYTIPIEVESYGGCFASYTNYIYVVGGLNWTSGHSYEMLQVLNLSSNSWIPNAPMMHLARHSLSCIVHPNRNTLYAIGGEIGGTKFAREWRSSIELIFVDTDIRYEQWLNNAYNLIKPLSLSRSVVYGDDILVIGGRDDVTQSTDMQVINTITGQVSIELNALSYQVLGHALAILEGVVYAFGGYSGSKAYSDWQYYTLPPIPTTTSNPSGVPTSNPSNKPTNVPSTHPTYQPSNHPTTVPTKNTAAPSDFPSNDPTSVPTKNTATPSTYPTIVPTKDTATPSDFSSTDPTIVPTKNTAAPSTYPTLHPARGVYVYGVPSKSPFKFNEASVDIFASTRQSIDNTIAANKDSRQNLTSIVISVIGGVLFIVAIVLLWSYLNKKNKKRKQSVEATDNIVSNVTLAQVQPGSPTNTAINSNDTDQIANTEHERDDSEDLYVKINGTHDGHTEGINTEPKSFESEDLYALKNQTEDGHTYQGTNTDQGETANVPSVWENWTNEDVLKWISSLQNGKFKAYAKEFRQQNVKGSDLKNIGKRDLVKLGVLTFEDRNKMYQEIEGLRSEIPENEEEIEGNTRHVTSAIDKLELEDGTSANTHGDTKGNTHDKTPHGDV
eukprot:721744_1